MLRACVLNFERLDIWRYLIGYPSINYCHFNLLWISVFNLESLNILQDSFGHPSKNYRRLNLLRTSVFNLEHLIILWDSIGHPSKKLSSLEFAQSFCFTLPASLYVTGLNRTSELKFIAVCIWYELPIKILSILIYYQTQLDIRVKSHSC